MSSFTRAATPVSDPATRVIPAEGPPTYVTVGPGVAASYAVTEGSLTVSTVVSVTAAVVVDAGSVVTEADGAVSGVSAGGEVVPVAEYRK